MVVEVFLICARCGTDLGARGWHPILAENGRTALEKLERETPSVILMDMRIADMNGFELAAIIKNRRINRTVPKTGLRLNRLAKSRTKA